MRAGTLRFAKSLHPLREPLVAGNLDTMFRTEETIAAISTVPGAAPRAIVRLSGPDAISISARLFTSPEAEKETLSGTRGGVHQGINIHSARMPSRMAHHELVFGTLGQTLTIRHDSINRESFMPGVVMAIRQVVESPGLTVGLENIMGL